MNRKQMAVYQLLKSNFGTNYSNRDLLFLAEKLVFLIKNAGFIDKDNFLEEDNYLLLTDIIDEYGLSWKGFWIELEDGFFTDDLNRLDDEIIHPSCGIEILHIDGGWYDESNDD